VYALGVARILSCPDTEQPLNLGSVGRLMRIGGTRQKRGMRRIVQALALAAIAALLVTVPAGMLVAQQAVEGAGDRLDLAGSGPPPSGCNGALGGAPDQNVFRVSRHPSFKAAVDAANAVSGGQVLVDVSSTIDVATGPVTVTSGTRITGLSRASAGRTIAAKITCDFPAAANPDECIRITGDDVSIENVSIQADADCDDEDITRPEQADSVLHIEPGTPTASLRNVRIRHNYLSGPSSKKCIGLFQAGCDDCTIEENEIEGFGKGVLLANTAHASAPIPNRLPRFIRNHIGSGVFGVMILGRDRDRADSPVVTESSNAVVGPVIFRDNSIESNAAGVVAMRGADASEQDGGAPFHMAFDGGRIVTMPTVVHCEGAQNAFGSEDPTYNACCLKGATITRITREMYVYAAGRGARVTAAGNGFALDDYLRLNITAGMPEIDDLVTTIATIGDPQFGTTLDTESATAFISGTAGMSLCNVGIYAGHEGGLDTRAVYFGGSPVSGIDVLRPGGAGTVQRPDTSTGDFYAGSRYNRFDQRADAAVKVVAANKPLNAGAYPKNNSPPLRMSGNQLEAAIGPADHKLARVWDGIVRQSERLDVIARSWNPQNDGQQVFLPLRPMTHADALAQVSPWTHGKPVLVSNMDPVAGDESSTRPAADGQCLPSAGAGVKALCMYDWRGTEVAFGTATGGSRVDITNSGARWTAGRFNGANGVHWVVLRPNTATEEWRKIQATSTTSITVYDGVSADTQFQVTATKGNAYVILKELPRLVRVRDDRFGEIWEETFNGTDPIATAGPGAVIGEPDQHKLGHVINVQTDKQGSCRMWKYVQPFGPPARKGTGYYARSGHTLITNLKWGPADNSHGGLVNMPETTAFVGLINHDASTPILSATAASPDDAVLTGVSAGTRLTNGFGTLLWDNKVYLTEKSVGAANELNVGPHPDLDLSDNVDDKPDDDRRVMFLSNHPAWGIFQFKVLHHFRAGGSSGSPTQFLFKKSATGEFGMPTPNGVSGFKLALQCAPGDPCYDTFPSPTRNFELVPAIAICKEAGSGDGDCTNAYEECPAIQIRDISYLALPLGVHQAEAALNEADPW